MTVTIESLRAQWAELYSQTLPSLARAHDPAQPKWPVILDHCFARIILDNTVGQGVQQWDKVIKKPAVRNMSEKQLQDAIELGEKICSGQMDLTELDQISLLCRGKNKEKYGNVEEKKVSRKRKRVEAKSTEEGKDDEQGDIEKNKRQSTLSFAPKSPSKEEAQQLPPSPTPDILPGSKFTATSTPEEFKVILKRIHSYPGLTAFRKRLYTVLLSVPRGRHTTYAAMSDYLHSCARAVGNGMRHNHFAPEVPCHRVLASDGSLGGFFGDWGREGKYAKEKIDLLRSEGVRFDVKGKVVGEPWRNFHEFEGWDAG